MYPSQIDSHDNTLSAGRLKPTLRTLLLAVALLVPALARAQDPEPVARPQAQPYSVRVLVAFDDVPKFSPRIRVRVIGEIRDAIERYAGGMWNPQVEEHRALIPATSATLAKLT